MTGTLVVGSLQYKQLLSGVNVKQLIQLGVQLPVQDEASINVAINNDAMIYDDSTSNTKYTTESIGYIVICSPTRSLQNDTNLSFQLAMDFKMNYVFWTDVNNVFAYSLMADSADPKDHMQPQPIIPAGRITSYQVADPTDFKGDTLWQKTQNILKRAGQYSSKAVDIAKVLAPFLAPTAGGVFSLGMGALDLLKSEEPVYDLNQNIFMYKQMLKNIGYTQIPPDLQVAQKRLDIIDIINEMINYQPSVSGFKIDDTKSEAPTTPKLAHTF